MMLWILNNKIQHYYCTTTCISRISMIDSTGMYIVWYGTVWYHTVQYSIMISFDVVVEMGDSSCGIWFKYYKK